MPSTYKITRRVKHMVERTTADDTLLRATMQEMNRRSSRARRTRGYGWEGTLVKRFNALDGWGAYRLGSSSTSLPDVLALNPAEKTAFIIEAKSGTTNRLAVPMDQIARCVEWHRLLRPFDKRRIVLAFKFLSKRHMGRDRYGMRRLREFYKEWDARKRPIECVCLYDGTIYGRDAGRRVVLVLEDCALPAKPTRRADSTQAKHKKRP